ITGSPRRPSATCRAAACASVLERPTTKLAKVRRGSSGEPPRASWVAGTGEDADERNLLVVLPYRVAWRVAACFQRDRRFLGGHRRAHRRAHGQVDAMHFRHLGLPAGEHALSIM